MRHTPIIAATTMQNNDKNLKLEIKIFCPSCELVFSKRLLQTFLSQRLDAINDWFGIWEKILIATPPIPTAAVMKGLF